MVYHWCYHIRQIIVPFQIMSIARWNQGSPSVTETIDFGDANWFMVYYLLVASKFQMLRHFFHIIKSNTTIKFWGCMRCAMCISKIFLISDTYPVWDKYPVWGKPPNKHVTLVSVTLLR